jgi:hypothetical protein
MTMNCFEEYRVWKKRQKIGLIILILVSMIVFSSPWAFSFYIFLIPLIILLFMFFCNYKLSECKCNKCEANIVSKIHLYLGTNMFLNPKDCKQCGFEVKNS